VAVLVEKVHFVFITSIAERVETEIPGLELLSERGRVADVTRKVLEAHCVELVVEHSQPVGAIHVERIVALRPEDL
jgi:hypothetical protein